MAAAEAASSRRKLAKRSFDGEMSWKKGKVEEEEEARIVVVVARAVFRFLVSRMVTLAPEEAVDSSPESGGVRQRATPCLRMQPSTISNTGCRREMRLKH